MRDLEKMPTADPYRPPVGALAKVSVVSITTDKVEHTTICRPDFLDKLYSAKERKM